MTKIYGISNCDTVKKALKWLEQHNIAFEFHDFRKDGLDQALLLSFQKQSSWDALINKRSTTYRNLPQDVKDNLSGDTAVATILEQPTLIKRPVLVTSQTLHIGFKPAQYQELFIHE
ncbi:ArsC family reductase [Thalassotalea sp. PLHSN55]|uniref:ArsC family reductase n=1 Tax=Thalassotalea sp. PLHSN55 TaxID=3435888 RepID=UPI003F8659BC